MPPCLLAARAVPAVARTFLSLRYTVSCRSLSSSASPGPSERSSMGLEQLRQGKIIPDVVDKFHDDKVSSLRVLYNGVEVANGAKLRVAEAQPKPHVEFQDLGVGDHLHTVIVVDPDAPSPQKPSFRHFLHWIVTNIPGSLPSTQEIWEQGREVVPYMGPAPPEGEHRYVFLAYRQPQGLYVQPPQERKNFNIQAFTRQYNLSFPLAATYFVSEHGQ